MCERLCRREGTRSNALSCYDSIMRRSLYELVPAHTYTCLQLVCMHSGCHVTYQRSRSGSHRSLLIAQKKNGILPAGKDEPVRNLRAFCLSRSDCLGLSLCFPLSSPVQRLHNAHQLFSGGLWVSSAKPITDGVLC